MTAVKVDTTTEKPKNVDPPKSFGTLMRDCLLLANLGVVSKDSRIIGRMLRRVALLRNIFESDVYVDVVRILLLPTSPVRAQLLLDNLQNISPCKPSRNPDVEMSETPQQPVDSDVEMVPTVAITPKEFESSIHDIELLLSTLGLMLLIDNRRTANSFPIASSIVESLSQYPPPHKYDELILGKALFYCYRVYELEGRAASLKGFLMDTYRTAVLHRQATPQAIALNLLLRNFLQQKLYDQAVKIIEKAPYPEGLRSNAQHARYLYYLARINAVRLDYGEAYSKVIQAIRKAPQEGSVFGKGFRLAAHKLCFAIQLLMGEIPDRRYFNQKDLRTELIPYAKIVQAVRSGGLTSFNRVMVEQIDVFKKDGNIDLIQRLHHNVIRVGLRKIGASYSTISLDDVALKLGLSSNDDVECIVSKAIADSVIDATIDCNTKTVYCKSHQDKTVSDEPCKAFHHRIAFCLQLYNEALKAMQYPEAENDSKIEEAEARRKEHQEQMARAEKDEFEGGDDGEF